MTTRTRYTANNRKPGWQYAQDLERIPEPVTKPKNAGSLGWIAWLGVCGLIGALFAYYF